MLEPIRQFTDERLRSEVPDEYELRIDAHAHFFLDLAERLAADLVTARQREALDELALEHANLRVAWERAEGDLPLQIASCMTRFWNYRGYPNEGRAVLARVIAAHPDAEPAVRVRALLGAAQLAVLQHDLDVAASLLDEAAALNDAASVAETANLRGEVARLRGDFGEADRLYAEALVLARDRGNERLIGLIRSNQGLIARQLGDHSGAATASREALEITEAFGDLQGSIRALGNLGLALLATGHVDQALDAFERSRALAQAHGDPAAEAFALHNLVIAMLARPEGLSAEAEAQAETYLRRAITVFDELGYRRELATALALLPAVSNDVDHVLRALKRARDIFGDLGDAARAAQTAAEHEAIAAATSI
jgi:tetratricopeptide (TPR) repeat protein